MTLRFGILGLVVFSAYLLPQLEISAAWDRAAVAALAAAREPGWTRFFHFVSNFSDIFGFLVAWLLPVAFFFGRKRWATGLSFFLGVGLLKVSVWALKVLIEHPRPPDGLEFQTTFSMPSGHAANAVFMFGVPVVLFWPRVHAVAGRIALFLLGCAGIALVGLSRVYLGAHYPSDVVVGSLYTAAGLWVLQGMRKDVFTLY